MIWDWHYAQEVLPEILGAFAVTLQATLAGFVLAVLLGLAWAIARMAPLSWLARGVTWLVEFVRSTPLLIQLYFLYYVLPEYGLTLSPFTIGILALGLHYSCYTAEVYRAGIEAVPRGQWEAARALNLSPRATWRRVILPQALRVEIAGSLRRGRETIGDIDILVASEDPQPIMDATATMRGVSKVLAHGAKKTSVLLGPGVQVDVRVVEPQVFGSALHYFTGSKEHHVKLRTRAKRQGLKISEYGVFREGSDEAIACATEEDVFAALGLAFIPPELREGVREIDAAQDNTLPQLITLADVRGDLHMHTTASDGEHSILEMAQAAKALGYEYIVITDHSQSLTVANGLTPERLERHIEAIREADRQIDDFRILSGLEVDILKDGALDMTDELLRACDWVVGSVHSLMNQTSEVMTQRLLRAISSGLIQSLGHPTGRILGGRGGYVYDMEAILAACKAHGVAVEINGSTGRLDFNAEHAALARDRGVKIVHVNFVFDRDMTELIGRAMGDPRRKTAAGEPGRETFRIVVPPRPVPLGVGSAAEFSSEPDDGVIEQSALFQVGEETGVWLEPEIQFVGFDEGT